jgi:phosphopantetheinyl transferase
MTDIYIMSTVFSDTGMAYLENNAKKLDEASLKRIKETKNEQRYKERLAAYSLLSFAVGGESISFSESGKPYLCDGGKFISLSHTSGACAVAVSNEGEVGVDIELYCEESERRAESAASRFFPAVCVNPSELSVLPGDAVKIHFMTLSECGISEEKENLVTVAKNQSSLYTWVSAEAILKADGRGLCAAACVEKIQKRSKIFATSAVKIEENLFFLSLAVL